MDGGMGGVVIITRLRELSCSNNQHKKPNRLKGTRKWHIETQGFVYACVCAISRCAPVLHQYSVLKFVP